MADPRVRWRFVNHRPWFDNQVARLELDGRRARMVLEKTLPQDGDEGSLGLEEVFAHQLA